MKIWVVGTGYVGLVTGLCLAKLGHEVWCIDQDQKKIKALNERLSPIYEPGLTELLVELQAMGRVHFSVGFSGIDTAEIALVAVGTPTQPSGEADLTYVYSVVEDMAVHLTVGALLVVKSTVPVGTTANIRARLHKLGRHDLDVAFVPEFLREGCAIEDTLNPHRLIYGVTSDAAKEILERMHQGLESPVVVCEPETAEMIKYASNAFLATKIAFINEIANICNRVNADVTHVAFGMGLDPRIGAPFLRAGLGYGGSCFPKDTRALVSIASKVNYDFSLLRSVIDSNQKQRLQPLYQLLRWFETLDGAVVTLLGAAFKPGTDDTRESPAVDLAAHLIAHGARVRMADPVVSSVHVPGYPQPIRVHADPYEALLDADAAVLVTEWPEFVDLDWVRVRNIMHKPFWFDGRNVLEPDTLDEAGLVLANVGRGKRSSRIASAL